MARNEPRASPWSFLTKIDEREMNRTPTQDDLNNVSFSEHVRLIERQDQVAPNEAKLRAWMEGPLAYFERLSAAGEGDNQ